MAKKLYEETDVQDIATAIRSKNGTSTTYKVSEMAAAINEISGDGTGSAELTAHIANKNNPHNVTAAQVGADVSGAAATVQSNLNTHSNDTTKHITAAERTKWDAKQDALTFDTTPIAGSSNPITSGGVKEALKNLGTGTGSTDISLGLTSATVGQIAKIKTVDSDGKPTEWEPATIASGGGSSGDAEAVQANLDTHIADTTKHVTATERSAWNAKQDAIPYTCVPETVYYIENPNEECEDEATMSNSAFDTIPVPGQLWYDATYFVWRFCSSVKGKTSESTSTWKKLMVSEDVAEQIRAAPKILDIEILETICEDVELTDENPTYTLPNAITLDESSGVRYYLDYKHFNADGELSPSKSSVSFSKAGTYVEGISWQNNDENKWTCLTSTTLSSSWRPSGAKAVVSIYKVNISCKEEMLYAAMQAEGMDTTASGVSSHAEGSGTIAASPISHAEGLATTAGGTGSHAEGCQTYTSGSYSHAEGFNTATYGDYSHAEGKNAVAYSDYSHAEGFQTHASGMYSHAEGAYTIAGFLQHVSGKYNVEYDGPTSATDSTGSIFIVGNGVSDSNRSNAFRIMTDGSCMGTKAFTTSGADYAEYFEWGDGNPNGEDRRGYFVTLVGDKIRIATSTDEYILGVVSSRPSVIGDGFTDQWKGMYLTDVFGEEITETVTVPETTDEETGQVIPAHTEIRFVVNPEYDNTQSYIGRELRKEWTPVGLVGKLVVVDDGTCEVDGYCKVASFGGATKSIEKTPYRVMSRLDDTHIRVFIK